MKTHHPMQFHGWRLTFAKDYCDYCKKSVPTLIVRWMQHTVPIIRCAFCMLKIRSIEYSKFVYKTEKLLKNKERRKVKMVEIIVDKDTKFYRRMKKNELV